MNKKYIGEIAEAAPEKIEKLDVKDRKILYVLNKNGRLSINSIAKIVGLSREVVTYRLKRLEKKGILNGFITLIDVLKLGLQRRIVYLRIHNFTEEQELEIIEKMTNMKKIIWIATTSGKWDVGIIIYSKTAQEFEDTFSQVREAFGKLLIDFTIFDEVFNRRCDDNFIISEIDFDYDISKIKDTNAFSKSFDSQEKDVQVDDKDMKIMKLLINDARMSLNKIAGEVKLNIDTVKKRIEKLIQGRIIYGFMPQISFFKLGYQWHWLFLRINRLDPKTDEKIKYYCDKYPNIVWCVKHIGTWDWELSVFTKDSAQLREVINDIRKEFHDIIIDYDSLLVFSQYKYITLLE
jgi:Lrp/AsnC family leucine-responsive transcriptional regulator